MQLSFIPHGQWGYRTGGCEREKMRNGIFEQIKYVEAQITILIVIATFEKKRTMPRAYKYVLYI